MKIIIKQSDTNWSARKIRALEQVEKANPEAEIRKYRKNLLEITHFKAPEYRPRRWMREETINIPLESKETVKDPRILKHKMPTHTEMPQQKTWKPCEDLQPTTSTNYKDTADTHNIQNISENPQDSSTNIGGGNPTRYRQRTEPFPRHS